MLWVTRGRNPTQTILNDNGLKWTREMGDLRCRAACRQDPPSQQIPRTQFLPPSTWPLRLTCLAVLQFPRLLGRQPCSLLKKDSVPANVLRVILIGPTQVMHPPQSQSLQPREGCVWTSWPESPAPSFLQSQDTESASLEPHRAPLGVQGLPGREGGRDAGRYPRWPARVTGTHQTGSSWGLEITRMKHIMPSRCSFRGHSFCYYI